MPRRRMLQRIESKRGRPKEPRRSRGLDLGRRRHSLCAYTVITPVRDMAHLYLVPKRAPTRHDLEQQLDALARAYGVSKDEKVFEQMLEVCRQMQVFDDYREILKR